MRSFGTLFSLFLFSFSLFHYSPYNKQYMRYIGIDMSKDTFHASFDAKHIIAFENTKEGIRYFMRTLEEKKYIKSKTKIAVESTGVYHLPLAATFSRENWNIAVINPLISSRAIQNDSLRRVKTDKKDAKVIQALARQGKGYIYRDTDEIRKLQALCAQRTAIVHMRSQCKQRLHAMAVRAEAIEGDISEPYTALIRHLTNEIRLVEKTMAKTAEETQKLLRSIPGIGITASAMLVGYIGTMERFETADQLAAYIGIDPRVYQSGTSIHGKGYISKRGNKPLRSILFSAAFIAQRRDPELRAYYMKKRSKGKHHFVILCAIERRIINRIFAVWKRGTPYEKKVLKS
jgi:transposase